MSLRNAATEILGAEHKIHRYLLDSAHFPFVVKRYYGLLRNKLGIQFYCSRLCPVRTSPNRIICFLLRPGQVYIDVGANEGQMVGLDSLAVGVRGGVYAFEPRKQASYELRQMVSAYSLRNVCLFQYVVADREGEALFYECPEHPSSSSMESGWAGGVEKRYPSITLDKWADNESVKRVDLIKIDAEGAELKVLQGARGLLANRHPVLIIEVSDPVKRENYYHYNRTDLIDIARSIGYNAFFSFRREGLCSVESESDFKMEDCDMIAFADNGVTAKLLQRHLASNSH